MADVLEALRRAKSSERVSSSKTPKEKRKNKLPLPLPLPLPLLPSSFTKKEENVPAAELATGTLLHSTCSLTNGESKSRAHARPFVFNESPPTSTAPAPPRPKKKMKRRHSSVAAAASAEAGPSRKKKRPFSKDTWSHISIPPTVAHVPQSIAPAVSATAMRHSILTEQRQQDQHIYHLERLFREACDEIKGLKLMMEKTKAECAKRELGVRQDLLFKAVLQQDRAEKQLQYERNRWSRIVASEKAEKDREIEKLNETHEKMLDDERVRFNAKYRCIEDEAKKAKQDYNNMWTNCQIMQMHYDSSQSTLRAVENDLTELQRLENEERVQREDTRRGEPPAYNSIADQKGYLPPYEAHRHRDHSTFSIATLTELTQGRFDAALERAVQRSLELRESADRRLVGSAGSELFAAASEALAATAKDLNRVMNHTLETQLKGNARKRSFAASSKHPIYIAEHVARLLIDSLHNLLAAMDLRGYCGAHMTGSQKLANGVHFRQIDDTLLLAIQTRLESTVVEKVKSSGCSRCESHHCGGYCARLHTASYYLGIVKSIRKKVDDVCSRDRQGTHFKETIAWLKDTIETERAQAATVAPPRARQGSPTPVMGDDEMAQAIRNSQMVLERPVVQPNNTPRSYGPSFTADSMLASTAVPSFEVSNVQQSSSAARQPPRRSPRRAASRLTPTALSSLFSDTDDNDLSDADSEHSEFHAGSEVHSVRHTNVTTRSQSRSSRSQDVMEADESG
ncbi:hypothetical protein AC579_10132 [Pseudocercospora musae]|uniref:Uncharacterized protein n=1 Tax=Pseudocercospora musae TaxID=113226 RepID=A0A139ISM4_9PEZI|nr:hypothetical protein AC579_10132 [Pseudocercospora musae]